MRRLLFTSALLLLLSASPTPAQFVGSRPGSFGGGFRTPAPAAPALTVPMATRPSNPLTFGPRGGSAFRMVQVPQPPAGRAGLVPLYPYPGIGSYRPGANGSLNAFGGYGGYGGFGGGFITSGYGGYGYGGYSPYFVVPGPYDYDYPPVPATTLPPDQPGYVVSLSGQATATLTMEFPADATVWLDGKEVAGDAAKVRSLTSPVIRQGEQYTFHVKARWEAGGKTYEYTRDVPLGPGDRSKVLVVSGTAVSGGE